MFSQTYSVISKLVFIWLTTEIIGVNIYWSFIVFMYLMFYMNKKPKQQRHLSPLWHGQCSSILTGLPASGLFPLLQHPQNCCQTKPLTVLVYNGIRFAPRASAVLKKARLPGLTVKAVHRAHGWVCPQGMPTHRACATCSSSCNPAEAHCSSQSVVWFTGSKTPGAGVRGPQSQPRPDF